MKICATCGVNKPLSEYYKRKRSKDGRESACKACRLARTAEVRKARNGNSGKCRVCGEEREYGNTYCELCKEEIVKYERRNQSQIYQLRTNPDYKPYTKTSECDACILAIDCLERVKRGIDCYCWDGEDTNNRYYYLYERAREMA